jgi:Zn-dependent peptidase ImmA (M78 family)/transcriptional regulator with XRE-family HTH domain
MVGNNSNERFVPGDRIVFARTLAGLTQQELASRLGVDVGTVSEWENRGAKLHPENLRNLCDELGFGVAFFTSPEPVASALEFHFRSRQAASIQGRTRARAIGQIAADVVRQLETSVGLPDFKLPSVDIEVAAPASRGSEVAMELRATWGLGLSPLVHMTSVLESNGIPVFFGFHEVLIDAYSVRTSSRPITLHNVVNDPYRHRHSIAHELGHLVMHNIPLAGSGDSLNLATKHREAQAGAFASTLLLPTGPQLVEELEEAFANQFWSGVLEVKERWGASLSSIVRRAHDLGVIDDDEYVRRFRNIAKRGWKTREPGQRAYVESPALIARKLDELAQLYPQRSLAQTLGVPDSYIELLRRRAPEE